MADDRVAFIAELVKTPIVAQTFCANSDWRTGLAQIPNAAIPRSYLFGRAFGQGRTVGSPASIIGGGSFSRYPVSSRMYGRRRQTSRMLLVVKVVVAHRIRAEGWVVFVRR